MGIVVPIVIGVVIGAISGLVGVGGGALLIPILVYGYAMTQKDAQGTSLAMLLGPSGILAFWEYYRAGHVHLKLGLLIAAGVLLGGFIGGRYAQHLSNLTLRRIFALFLAVIAVKMFFEK